MPGDLVQMGSAGAFFLAASELLRFLREKRVSKSTVPRGEFDAIATRLATLERAHRALKKQWDEADLCNAVSVLQIHARRRGWKIDDMDVPE